LPAAEGTLPLTLGTAGHIDHGKTTLVAALTGKNTDRLAEERRRGISIELGYARLELPGGVVVSVVDVPGHERLVRTMVAGASGFALFLLVIADDGVMPQTREHLAVLRALGVERGVIALTKADAVEPHVLAASTAEAQALVPAAPLVRVSARTGEGLPQLRQAIADLAAGATARTPLDAADSVVLHADRVFSRRGIGTIATGTLWSGRIGRGDRLRALPSGETVRVRSIGVHDEEVEAVSPGGRVALALAGADRRALAPGGVLVSPGSDVAPSYRLDVVLEIDPRAGDLDGERVQVHHGTRQSAARIVTLGEFGLAQLRLETPMMAREGDRFVVRTISAPDTVGGGTVLDPSPRRHGPGPATARARAIRRRGLAAVRAEEGTQLQSFETRRSALPAIQPEPRAQLLLALLEADGVEPRPPTALAQALRVDPEEAERLLGQLVGAQLVVRAGERVFYPASTLASLRERALALASGSDGLRLPEVRTALGTSRKYAQALLDHLDARGDTVRQGDVHVLRRPGAG